MDHQNNEKFNNETSDIKGFDTSIDLFVIYSSSLLFFYPLDGKKLLKAQTLSKSSYSLFDNS